MSTSSRIQVGRSSRCCMMSMVIQQQRELCPCFMNVFTEAQCMSMLPAGFRNCNRCKIAKGPYVEPNPIQGSMVANNPLDLVCQGFTKVEPSHHKCILQLHSCCKVTPNQKAQTVTKVLIDKWFYT